jgi:hypothetical protein
MFAISRFEALAEECVERDAALGDRSVCQLGQLMVAQNQVDPFRVLTFEGRDNVDELV